MSSAMERVLALARSPTIDIQQEALWVICNCISCGGEDERRALFLRNDGQCIAAMLGGLEQARDARLATNILEALVKLLETDAHFRIQGQEGSVYQALAAAKPMDHMEALSNRPQQAVYDAAEGFQQLFSRYEEEFGGQDCVLEPDNMNHNHYMNGLPPKSTHNVNYVSNQEDNPMFTI